MLKSATWLMVVGLVLILSGCATNHHGVSEESRRVLSDRDRQEARRQYNERRTAEADVRAAREQRLRVEREADLLRLEAELEARRNYAAHIYNGTSGQHGDLLRITLREGRMNYRGHHHHYQKTRFIIAAGDVKQVPIVMDGRRTLSMNVSYHQGKLWFDTDKYGYRTEKAFKLTYKDEWRKRQVFAGARSNGELALSGVTIEVEAIELPRRRQQATHHPQTKVVVNKTVVNNTRVTQVNQKVKNTVIKKRRTINNNQTQIVNNETNIHNTTKVNKVNNRTHVDHSVAKVDNRVTNVRHIENRNNSIKVKKGKKKVPSGDSTDEVSSNDEEGSEHDRDFYDGNHGKRHEKRRKEQLVKRPRAEKSEDHGADHSETHQEHARLNKHSREKQASKNQQKVALESGVQKNFSQLRLKVREGTLKIGDEKTELEPGEYVLKPGETRKLKMKTRQGRPAVIWVRCTPKNLSFSDDGKFGSRAVRMAWRADWETGKGQELSFDKTSPYREVKVKVFSIL